MGDFGLATKLLHDGERKKTVCGTPNYIAPEVLSSKIGHSYEVDIWSLGVILYTLLIGKPPFETSDVKKTYDKIKKNDYCFPENIVISNSAKNLIKRILENEPSKRITLEEIEHHEFLNQGNIIPKVLPTATLACPPTISYLRKIMPEREINVEEEEKNVMKIAYILYIHIHFYRKSCMRQAVPLFTLTSERPLIMKLLPLLF